MHIFYEREAANLEQCGRPNLTKANLTKIYTICIHFTQNSMLILNMSLLIGLYQIFSVKIWSKSY